MQCEAHPSVETELGCSKCGKAICPRCLYHTPVGSRCRECANVRRLPQYQLSLGFALRGLAAALVVGVALGGLWGVLIPFRTTFFFGLIVGVGLGYAVGEAVSLATNRKAVLPLQAMAVGGVVVAYLVRSAVLASGYRNVDIFDILTADVFGYIVVALGAFVAAGRLR